MITKEQAIELGLHGGEIHYGKCKQVVGPRGGTKTFIERWRANGKCQTWATHPDRFRLPIKHGLYRHAYLTHSNAGFAHLAKDCPLLKQK